MFPPPPSMILAEICRQATSPPQTQPCTQCTFVQNTSLHPFQGGQCTVYALQDHNDRQICLRIYKDSSEISTYLVRQELRHRQEIEKHAIQLFQPVLWSSEVGNCYIKSPFVAMNWVDGNPLTWTDENPEKREERERIIKSIANVSLDLLAVQQEGPPAKQYATAKIQRKINRAEEGTYPGGNVESCLKQLDLLDTYWIPELDSSPHVLVHGDLSPLNVIVDHEKNVQGIIDLGFAEVMPLQFAATYPRFLTHEPTMDPGQQSKVFHYVEKDTEVMRRDRLFFRDCVGERAGKEGGCIQAYYDLLCRKDEVRRSWWFKAISERDTHRAMVACGWRPDMETDE